jgi:hypothetical protein
MSNLTNIVIGLIVVGLLLVRQLQARPAKETPSSASWSSSAQWDPRNAVSRLRAVVRARAGTMV